MAHASASSAMERTMLAEERLSSLAVGGMHKESSWAAVNKIEGISVNEAAHLTERAVRPQSTMRQDQSIEIDQSYVYTPLRGDRHIRILQLWPAEASDAPIRCLIEEIDLTDEPLIEYTALSYSWATEDGNASANQVIELDGRAFPISTNLYHALHRFRAEMHSGPEGEDGWAYGAKRVTHDSTEPTTCKPLQEPQPRPVSGDAVRCKSVTKPRADPRRTGQLRLWVDAICINQADDAEKGHQVSMMGQIYSSAKRVVAWLGESGDECADVAAYQVVQCLTADLQAQIRINPDSTIPRAAIRDNNDTSRSFAFELRHVWVTKEHVDEMLHEEPDEELDEEPDEESDESTDEDLYKHPQKSRTRIGATRRLRRKRCSVCAGQDDAFVVQLPLDQKKIVVGLLDRRYLTRRWIVQEIGLPKEENVHFMWGSKIMSKNKLASVVQQSARLVYDWPAARLPKALLTLHDPDLDSDQGASRLSQTADLLTRCRPGASLAELMSAVRGMDCWQPRDLIYSLLALASQKHEIQADYTCSVTVVSKQFAMLLVAEGRILPLFRQCCGRGLLWETIPLGLPSWAPDLMSCSHDFETRGYEQKFFRKHCQATCSKDGVLSINMYCHGVIGDIVAKEPTKARRAERLMVDVRQRTSGELIDTVALYDRDVHSGSRHPSAELRKQDVLCTFYPPHRRPDPDRYANVCCILRPLQRHGSDEATRVVACFDRKHNLSAVWTASELTRFNII